MIGLFIPLYIYPSAIWDELISIKTTYPSLPIIAVINPENGPGTSQNAEYSTWITKLQAASIIIVGYDHTSYGARSVSVVKADIDRYSSFYPSIDGIFFDEMSHEDTGNEAYYSVLSSYAKAKGFPITIGNPGCVIPLSYMQTVDYIVVSENTIAPDLSSYEAYSGYDSRLVMIAFEQATLPSTWVKQVASKIGWIYVTDDMLPNPYDVLPSYLNDLAGLLDEANTSISSKFLD